MASGEWGAKLEHIWIQCWLELILALNKRYDISVKTAYICTIVDEGCQYSSLPLLGLEPCTRSDDLLRFIWNRAIVRSGIYKKK